MFYFSGSQPFFRANQIYWKNQKYQTLRLMHILMHNRIKTFAKKSFFDDRRNGVESSTNNFSLTYINEYLLFSFQYRYQILWPDVVWHAWPLISSLHAHHACSQNLQ